MPEAEVRPKKLGIAYWDTVKLGSALKRAQGVFVIQLVGQACSELSAISIVDSVGEVMADAQFAANLTHP